MVRPILFKLIIGFSGNNCFNISSFCNKCLCLLIISLAYGPRELNSTGNITEVVVTERFFFFFATERDTFSILSSVDFTVFGLYPLATE